MQASWVQSSAYCLGADWLTTIASDTLDLFFNFHSCNHSKMPLKNVWEKFLEINNFERTPWVPVIALFLRATLLIRRSSAPVVTLGRPLRGRSFTCPVMANFSTSFLMAFGVTPTLLATAFTGVPASNKPIAIARDCCVSRGMIAEGRSKVF